MGDYVLFISLSITFWFSYSLLIVRLFIFSFVNCLPILLFYLASCQILSVYRRWLSSFITSFNQRNNPPYWNWVRSNRVFLLALNVKHFDSFTRNLTFSWYFLLENKDCLERGMDKQGFKFVSITSPKRASFDGSNLCSLYIGWRH